MLSLVRVWTSLVGVALWRVMGLGSLALVGRMR